MKISNFYGDKNAKIGDCVLVAGAGTGFITDSYSLTGNKAPDYDELGMPEYEITLDSSQISHAISFEVIT